MKQFFLQLFTWWNGQTLGTRFFTFRKGKYVGEDEYGNLYYQEHSGARRWVIYKGEADASKIPAGWHGWIHHRHHVAPCDEDYKPHEWQKTHQANPTGTPRAYQPPGSILSDTPKPRKVSGYSSWSPE